MTDQPQVPPPHLTVDNGQVALILVGDLIRRLSDKGHLSQAEVRAMFDNAVMSGNSPAAQAVIRRDLSIVLRGV